jgi:hypothetical protein
MKQVLIFAAIGEAATGLALLIVPSPETQRDHAARLMSTW